MPHSTGDVNTPNYERPEVVAARPLQSLIRDLLGGTEAMHTNATAYIHKWTDEADETYRFRSTLEQCYEGLGRTLSASTGMLFAKPPALEFGADEATLTAHLENIDGAGNDLSTFAKRFAESAIGYGHAVILVDHPTPPEGTTITAANEGPLNLRPFWRRYDRESVLSWRTATVDNVATVVQVVLYEPTLTADGVYGVSTEDRYRLLRLMRLEDGTTGATWALFGMNDKGDVIPYGTGAYTDRTGTPLRRLPLAVGYAGRTDAPLVSKPPLAGVAWANLGHYQQSSNLRFYREVAAFPQPTVAGDLKDASGNNTTVLPLGPLAGVHLATADASYTWTELQGTSLDQVEKGVTEKAQQMAAMGMSFLVRDTRAAETAEAKKLDKTAENSTLATAADGIEDALDQAAEIHCAYLGIEKPQAFTVAINRDFDAQTMDPQTMVAYVTAVEKAGLPPRLLLEAWQQAGRIPAEADLDVIESEMLANAEAARDAAAVQAEAQADASADRLAA